MCWCCLFPAALPLARASISFWRRITCIVAVAVCCNATKHFILAFSPSWSSPPLAFVYERVCVCVFVLFDVRAHCCYLLALTSTFLRFCYYYLISYLALRHSLLSTVTASSWCKSVMLMLAKDINKIRVKNVENLIYFFSLCNTTNLLVHIPSTLTLLSYSLSAEYYSVYSPGQ